MCQAWRKAKLLVSRGMGPARAREKKKRGTRLIPPRGRTGDAIAEKITPDPRWMLHEKDVIEQSPRRV